MNIEWLKNKTKEKFYPITHAKAVLFGNSNKTLDEEINDLNSNKLDKTTVASSSILGLVKSGTDITVDTYGNVSVNDNSHKHTVSNISDLTATASELNVLDGITATTQELNYVDGVTSNIQTQLNSKSSNGHTHDDRYYTESEIDTTVTDINSSISSHTSNTSNPHSVTKAQVGLGNVENKSSATIRGEITKSNVTTALGYTPYTPNEVDNKFSALETNIDWKESVATYNDITTTYPNPVDGWTVNVKDTDYTYRYNGTSWVAISANAIPKATNSVDGLLSKEDHANYEDANSKKHTHSNKSVLDGISSTNISNWNAAKTHADSAHAPSNAQANQNAFSNIAIGSTTIAADTTTDTLTLTGSNVTLTPDATNDKVTIGITKDNVINALGYTPGSASVATSSNLGLVKSGTDITVDSSGNVSVNDDSHNHVISNVDGLQSALDGKASSSHTHTKSEVGLGNVDNTADASKNVKSSKKLQTYKQGSTTETYGDNYPVYAQWRDSSHVKLKCDNYTVETDYATSAGSAANASKVNNHTVEANVPANAKFTDTNTWRPLGTTADTACAGNDSRLSNARAANGSGYVSELVGVQSNNTPYSHIEGNIIRAVWNTKSDNRWYLKAGDCGCRVSCADNADSVSWSNVSGKPSSMPASDVYAWAKASSKPSYSWSEITSKPSTFTPASHTHSYAGSSSAGGSATSAVKLDSSAGSATRPVYFSSGKPVTCNYNVRPINSTYTSLVTNAETTAFSQKGANDMYNTLNSNLHKFNFTSGSKSIIIGSGNAPVFFNLSVKPDSYYIISACFRVQRGSAKLDACISDGFRNWNECVYDTSGAIYPMVSITLCTHAVTNISLALTAAWSPATGTYTSDCWYTMIEIS